MSGTVTTGSVLMAHEAGLHARPSVKLTKLAKQFASRVELALAAEGPWIDAKSIVKVMATKAPKNTVLHFRAEGEDAKPAVEALIALVMSDFEEAPANDPETWRMPEPVELKGRSASPGVAAGPLFRLDVEVARRLPTGNAEAGARSAERGDPALDRPDRRPDERR